MEIAVVIAARDAERTLGATLDGLAAQTLTGPFEVVVVDNGSHDQTAALADAHPLDSKVIRRARGEGPGAARNDGVAATTAPVIAFTDSDCVPTPGWLTAGLAAMRGADLVQGRVSLPPGAQPGPFDRAVRVDGETGLYETANLFVRREAFQHAGGFEDWVDAGRPFGEDALLAWQLRRAGARTAFAADAEVHHAVLGGDAGGYLAERRREALFAGLVARVPELRSRLWHGYFLGPRAAAADLAVVGIATAAMRRSPLTLVAALPWLRLVRREARARGDGSARVVAVVAAGDLVGLVSRARGSLRWRTPVL